MAKDEKFEEKIVKLEKIVDELEKGEIDLDDSIAKYFDALKLVKECDEKLKAIEKQVTKMVDENGKEVSFEIDK